MSFIFTYTKLDNRKIRLILLDLLISTKVKISRNYIIQQNEFRTHPWTQDVN